MWIARFLSYGMVFLFFFLFLCCWLSLSSIPSYSTWIYSFIFWEEKLYLLFIQKQPHIEPISQALRHNVRSSPWREHIEIKYLFDYGQMAGRSQMDPTAQIFAGREGHIDLSGRLATCSIPWASPIQPGLHILYPNRETDTLCVVSLVWYK